VQYAIELCLPESAALQRSLCREVFEVVKHEGRAIILVNVVQTIEHGLEIRSTDVIDVVDLLYCILQRFLRKSLLASALLQKLTVQCG